MKKFINNMYKKEKMIKVKHYFYFRNKTDIYVPNKFTVVFYTSFFLNKWLLFEVP